MPSFWGLATLCPKTVQAFGVNCSLQLQSECSGRKIQALHLVSLGGVAVGVRVEGGMEHDTMQ